jgi:hypothetical protein
VETLTGRNGASRAADNPGTVAAINRVHWVLERYAEAFERHDVAALRMYRSSLNGDESRLLSARGVRVWLDGIEVRVAGQSATARCVRRIETLAGSGGPGAEQRPVTFTLARRPGGWIITDVR